MRSTAEIEEYAVGAAAAKLHASLGGTRRAIDGGATAARTGEVHAGGVATSSPVTAYQREAKEVTTSQSLAKAVTSIKGFNDNMDQYALHQFIVRNGHVVTDTPDFISWKKTHAADWGAIVGTLSHIEQWLRDYSIPIAFINGERLHALAVDELHRPTLEDLESCVANSKEVRPLLRTRGRRYLAVDGNSAAATVLQAKFRCHTKYTYHKREKQKNATVKVLQRRWRSHADMHRLRRELKGRRAAQLERWDALQQRFRDEWLSIRASPRVVVHIPSLSVSREQRLSIAYFDVRQNAQLARLFDSLSDPNVDVVYVTARLLPDEILGYLRSQLSAAGIENVERRFRVIVAENAARFPAHYLSLATLLLLSPKALARVRSCTHGAGLPGYIEGGIIGAEDRQLALALDLPLLGAEPENAGIEGTHSGARALFTLAGARVPPGVHDVYTESQVIHTLARVIAADPRHGRWLIVINNEWGGRGHAWFDTAKMGKTIIKLRVQQMKLSKMLPGGNRAYFSRREPQVRGQELVESEIARRGLAALVTIGCPEVFPSWKKFIRAFEKVGGSIEAGYETEQMIAGRPTTNGLIEPDGTVSLLSTHDRIVTKTDPYGCVGTVTPQQSVPYGALRDASTAIGKTLYARGVLGYFSVDFLAVVPIDASEPVRGSVRGRGRSYDGTVSVGTGAAPLSIEVDDGAFVSLLRLSPRRA